LSVNDVGCILAAVNKGFLAYSLFCVTSNAHGWCLK